MGENSKIEWTDATWNPVTGCTKVSAGCKNCYAERMAKRLAGRYGYPADEPFRVTLHPDRLDQPLRWRKPRRVFVCSMGDLFHEDVPDEFILRVFDIMAITPQHTYQVLTKRPISMLDWYERNSFHGWLAIMKPDGRIADNIWLGVSAEDQVTADKRIPLLLQIPAVVRFVSAEPLLGMIDLTAIPYRGDVQYYLDPLRGRYSENPDRTSEGTIFDFGLAVLGRIHWVIVGGESGPNARPMDSAWARALRDQCRDADVAFFMKQMAKKALIPDDLMIREFPE